MCFRERESDGGANALIIHHFFNAAEENKVKHLRRQKNKGKSKYSKIKKCTHSL